MLTIFGALILIAGPTPQAALPPIVAANPAEAVDPAALAEARDLLREAGFETRLEASSRQIADDTFNTLVHEAEIRSGEPLPADLRTRIHGILMDHVTRTLAELQPTALDDAARVYARHFTAAEIRELRQLQAQPVMVKFQQIAPQFVSELVQIGVRASARVMPEAQARLRSEIEAWERDQQSRRPPAG